ncbi:MAG: hypothetical protein LC104_01070 [Bacteroidales bacterium]|nr:hypothetical protein [Bacteroidales bacterium]
MTRQTSLLAWCWQFPRSIGRKLLSPWFRRNLDFERIISEQFLALRHELNVHQQALADLSQSNQEIMQVIVRLRSDFEAHRASVQSTDFAHTRDFLLPYIHELRELQKRVSAQSEAVVLPITQQRNVEAA